MPAGQPKKELLDHLDKVPTYVQTLQFQVKEPTVGKSATFVKVDHVIQETKNLMNIISKVVSTCFDCANKVSLCAENCFIWEIMTSGLSSLFLCCIWEFMVWFVGNWRFFLFWLMAVYYLNAKSWTKLIKHAFAMEFFFLCG